MNIWQSVKYFLIIYYSILSRRTVVTLFGTTYAVAGNVVKSIGRTKVKK